MNIEDSTKRTPQLTFCISCHTIGGAERRVLNLANRILELYPHLSIKFLITEELYAEYRKDSQLSPLISNPKLDIVLAEWPECLRQDQYSTRSSIIDKIIARSRRLLQYPETNTTVKPTLLSGAEAYEQLKKASWLNQMLEITHRGDHLHCFVGGIERNGGILVSQYDRRVVLEITSNRALPAVVQDLRILLPIIGPCPNLHLNCVSKTVYTNFLAEIGADYLDQYAISVGHYHTPFLPLDSPAPKSHSNRENIIIFGHRFVPPKNGLLFAQVIATMARQGDLSGWQVHFRGFGPEEEAIKTTLSQEITNGQVEVNWSRDLEGELQGSKIFVSIIATGSYPSQSVFQAMRNGNLLLLGDAGETADQFAHDDVYLTDINPDSIRSTLLQAMADAGDDHCFALKSSAMKDWFKTFTERSTQAEELIALHGGFS
jgi:hypothetical protein